MLANWQKHFGTEKAGGQVIRL